MCRGVARIQFERVLDDLDRVLKMAGLKGDHAQMMDRLGVLGIQIDDLPVGDLGLAESAALMQLDGLREERCNLSSGVRHQKNPWS
jgi:hypothetical protein